MSAGAPSQVFGAAGTGGAACALRVEGVSKSFPRRGRDASVALRDVSLAVREGEMVGLLGPNGAGKTTLLKIIATLLSPGSGRVEICGLDAARDSLRARSRLGLITCDERSFYWRLTGRHNLSFFAALYGVPRRQAAARVQELLEVLGLAEAADRPFHGYSSGMKQKLAIARGLLARPALALYDEPTRSLDPVSARNIRAWILRNRSESPRTGHLVATHQLQEAEQLCDRVLILSRGSVIAQGTMAEIRASWQGHGHGTHRITCRGFAANGNGPSLPGFSEESREGDVRVLRVRTAPGEATLSEALARVLRAGGTVLECQSEEVPFDDVFCSLVARDQARAAVREDGP